MTTTAKSTLPGLESLDLNDVTASPSASGTMDAEFAGASPLIVRLVVGYGSHAGVAADILTGFYMIGRHRECQIRPKSHSVSRHHCLIQHQSGVVRVFDLESKRGTYVNDIRMEPKKWQLLNHGDRLRCGSYWFNVAIYDRELDAELDSLSETNGKNLVAGYSNVDVGNHVNEVAEADLFDDENFSTLGEFDRSEPDADDQAKGLAEESSPKKANAKPSRLPKPKIQKNYRKSSSGSGFSFSMSKPDSGRILLATVAMLAVVGFLGRTIYKIQKGPPVKILRGID